MRYLRMSWFVVFFIVSLNAVAGDYEEGIGFQKSGRNAKAVFSFMNGVDAGDTRAMQSLSQAYLLGKGVNPDKLMAFKLMRKAANLKDAAAQAYFGAMCVERIVEPFSCNVIPNPEFVFENYDREAYSWFLIAGDELVKKLKLEDLRDKAASRLNNRERLEAEQRAQQFMSQQTPSQVANFGQREEQANFDQQYARDKEQVERSIVQEDKEIAKNNELLVYQKQLRTGTAKIVNIKDAWLAQENVADLMELMASPLLKPNNAIYGARLTLDAEERKSVLRAKWDMDSTESVLESPLQDLSQDTYAQGAMRISQIRQKYGGSVYYAQLNQSKKTVAFSDNMRIGQSVWVIGRYVENKKFKRVNRTEGTMPVLDVLYIGE